MLQNITEFSCLIHQMLWNTEAEETVMNTFQHRIASVGSMTFKVKGSSPTPTTKHKQSRLFGFSSLSPPNKVWVKV